MKLSKSKLSLAKVINENGGWPERALWAVQDNCIAFFLGGKPEYKSGDRCWYSNSIDGACVGTITCDEKVTNWHQTILSCEEYYQAYQKADADEWIEWEGGMKSPVESGVPVDVKTKDGYVHYDQLLGDACWRDNWGDASIISYRLHKPEVKPGLCESVMRSIPEPEEKPTIEQLAADYRNANDHAERKQQEADAAKADVEAKLTELVAAGKALGLVLSVAGVEPELVIHDWQDLQVGDIIECIGSWEREDTDGRRFAVTAIDPQKAQVAKPIRIEVPEVSCPGTWGLDFKFIRRP